MEADTTMTATAITQQQYVRHMNSVCRQAWGRIRELFHEYMREHSALERRERFAMAVQIPLLSSITFLIFDDMHMLGSPPGEERAIEEVIGPLQAAVELGQKRQPALYSAAEIEQHFSLYNRRALAYGLDACVITESNLRSIEA